MKKYQLNFLLAATTLGVSCTGMSLQGGENALNREEREALIVAMNNVKRATLYRGEDEVEAALLQFEELLDKRSTRGGQRNDKDLDELLHLAAKRNSTEVIGSLLRAGADIAATHWFGATVLKVAAKGGSKDVVEKLLSYNPHPMGPCFCEYETKKRKMVNAQDTRGYTALMEAVFKNDIALVGTLLGSVYVDANLKDKGVFNSTALMHAVRLDQLELVDSMMQYENAVDVNVGDINGVTPLMIAAEKGNKAMVSKLLSWRNIDVNKISECGNSALDYVNFKYADAEEIIMLLLDCETQNVNTRNKRGETALINAAWCGDLRKLGLLLNEGAADVSIADNEGDTALIIATRRNDLEAVKILLERSEIEVNRKNKRGLTALAIAQANARINSSESYCEIVKFIDAKMKGAVISNGCINESLHY